MINYNKQIGALLNSGRKQVEKVFIEIIQQVIKK